MKLTVTFKSQSSLTFEKISFSGIIYSRDWESFLRPLASRMTNDLSSHAWYFRITLSCLHWTRVYIFSQNIRKRAFHKTQNDTLLNIWEVNTNPSLCGEKIENIFYKVKQFVLSKQHKLFPFSIPLLSVVTQTLTEWNWILTEVVTRTKFCFYSKSVENYKLKQQMFSIWKRNVEKEFFF